METPAQAIKTTWYVYIAICSDNSLYTGITTDLNRRLKEHNSTANGAKYTRSRRPVRIVFSEQFDNRSLASKKEYSLKKMTHQQKIMLIDTTDG